MKKFIGLMVFLVSFSPLHSQANQCAAMGHITSVWAHSDGVTYLNMDAKNNCSCGIDSRFGFWRNDPDAKNWLAMALTANAGNKAVTIYSDTSICNKIGNTPHVMSFSVGN